MKVTVFGATGGIGREVVGQALDAGHTVTAVVRDASRLDVRHPALEVVTVAGLTDPDALLPALKGSDAAISGVGPRSRNDGPVASTTTRVILRALESAGVRRFVAVSAMPVGPAAPGESRLNKVLARVLWTLFRDVYTDLTAMEDAIRASHTDWTIVRPPKLWNRPLTGQYRTTVGANVPRGRSIARADVAHLMLAVLDDPATVRAGVGIAN